MNKRLSGVKVAAFCAGLLLLAAAFEWFSTLHAPAPLASSPRHAPAQAVATPFVEHLTAARPAAPSPRPAPQKLAEIDPTRPAPVDLRPPTAAPAERSPLADKLHDPQGTGLQDLRIVLNLFDRYRERFGGYPVGEDNAAFVRALTGRNPLGLAFLPADHLALDAAGQLLDRYGKPYFVHLLDRNEIELRSAGPDGQLYTPDDDLLPSKRHP